MGVLWPKNFKTHAIGGVDLMEVPTAVNKWDVVEDGHAVALVGYRSDSQFPGNGYFIYRNSWGETWGDHGYGYMPFEYILKYANDLFVYQMPTV
jgi:C1A family cysteine protease